MDLIKQIKEQTAIIQIKGRLDTVTAPKLEEEINALPSEVKELVLDMACLEYVSSAGLRVILSAQKKMSKLGGMKLLSVCDAVMEVFEITGFVDILVIE